MYVVRDTVFHVHVHVCSEGYMYVVIRDTVLHVHVHVCSEGYCIPCTCTCNHVCM